MSNGSRRGPKSHKLTWRRTRSLYPFDSPWLVILDLGLPDIQDHEMLRMIRARDDAVPVVVLSSRDDEAGKAQALDPGR